jgi:AraC-like DNA-binding protein
MKYLEIKPTSFLSDLVKCYWYLEKDYSVLPQPFETIFPDGCIDLVFHIVSNNQMQRQSAGFIIGQLKQPLALFSSGFTRVVGIRFFAYGAYPFLQMPLKELADQTTELGLLLGTATYELAEKLAELEPLDAFQELERFLLQRLSMNKADIRQIKAATNVLYKQQGAIEIEELANHANMTRRSLERKFAEVVGYPPKTLARILRFNHLRNELMFNPLLNLTDLGYRYNYFDQAHFIHDFQQFTGQTPSAFAEKVTSHDIFFYK